MSFTMSLFTPYSGPSVPNQPTTQWPIISAALAQLVNNSLIANFFSALSTDPGSIIVSIDTAAVKNASWTESTSTLSVTNLMLSGASVKNPSGLFFSVDLSRVLFHELVHAKYSDPNVLVPAKDAYRREERAIFLENTVYRSAFGGDERVGHSSVANPSATAVTYLDGMALDEPGTSSVFRFTLGGTEITKDYNAYNLTVSASATYQYDHYISVVLKSSTRLLFESGAIDNQKLSGVFSGIQADDPTASLNIAGKAILSVQNLRADLATALAGTSAGLDLLGTLRFFTLDQTAFKAVSAEAFADSYAGGPTLTYYGAATINASTTPDVLAIDGSAVTGAILVGGSGYNRNGINALDSIDDLKAGSGNDLLLAGNSRGTHVNLLDGGAGHDILIGGTGRDQLTGGDGDDLMLGGGDEDVFKGGAGKDVVCYTTASTGVSVDLSLRSGAADFSTAVGLTTAGTASDATGDKMGEIEILIGSSHNDILKGDGTGVTLSGGDGDDQITGKLTDLLVGGAGHDILHHEDGNGTLAGGGDNDELFGGAGVDTAGFGDVGSQYLVTQQANGTFTVQETGGAQLDGADTLTGIERASFSDGAGDLLRFSCTAGTTVSEGGTVTLKVSATRADGSGPSQDLWVYVKPDGTASFTDFDVTKPNQPPGLTATAAAKTAMGETGGFWVKIPKGQTEGSLTLLAKQDGVTEGDETAIFNIASYVQLATPASGSPYLDSPIHYDFNPVNASAPHVLVKDKTSSIALHQDGGYEGFFRTVSVSPNSTVNLSFNALTIPDYLKIWDPVTGQIYLDTSFMSDIIENSFTIDPDASGRLQIAVITNDPGTGWNLDVNSDAGSAAAAARGGALLQLNFLEAPAQNFVASVELTFGDTIITADTPWTSVQEEDPIDGGTKVYVARRGDLSEALTVGWRLEADGDNPVGAADFGGVLPEGVVTFDTDQANAQFGFTAVLDGFDEAPEGYHIVFFDPTTGTALTGVDGGPSALTGEIAAPPSDVINGTDSNNSIIAEATGSIIFAKAGDDDLTGGEGNDWIDAGLGDDHLDGGAGADTLIGGEGSDYYSFNQDTPGLVQDVVEDFGSASDFDVLDLGDFGDMAPSFAVEGDDVLITNPLTLQTIRLVGQLDGNGVERVTYYRFGYFNFLDRDTLANTAGGHTYHLGDGGLLLDTAYENSGAHLTLGADLAGLEQVFYRDGATPNDLAIDVGDGNTIRIFNLFTAATEGGFTGVTLANGTFLTVADLQEFAIVRGTDDSEEITLADGNDHVDAGEGDDIVRGGQGSEIYEYSLGDGSDTIIDTRAAEGDTDGDHNRLRLHGIDPAEVTGGRIDNGIALYFGDGGSVLLDHQLGVELPHRSETGLPAGGVTTIEFDDGTIWDAEAIKAIAGYVAPRPSPIGTSGADTLSGDYWDDDIRGLEGNDQIDGGSGGDDRLYGGAGDDTITGGVGLDLLDGGSGRDTLNGGNGADRLFGGAGRDILNGGRSGDELTGEGGIDVIHGDDGDDIVFAGDGDAANDSLDGGLDVDTLDYSSAGSAVTFDLAVGTASSVTEGVDSYAGFERLVGSQNDDTFVLDGTTIDVVGGDGADTYVVSPAAAGGAILIEDSSADANGLVLEGLNPADVVFRFVAAVEGPGDGGGGPDMRRLDDQDDGSQPAYLQIEIPATGTVIKVPSDILSFDQDGNKLFGLGRVTFANGTIWDAADISQAAWIRGTDWSEYLSGTAGNDTLDGGGGGDSINVGPGNDRVVYRSGDGDDQIFSYSGTSDSTLDLLDLTLGDIELVRSENDLLIRIGSTGQKIRVDGQFDDRGLATIHFSDGQTMDRANIEASAAIPPIIGTTGNDSLYGGLNPETFDGGLGNDILSGAGGDDIYVYRSGDGADQIYDYGGNAGDLLNLLDLGPADLRFTASGQDLQITVVQTGQIITLKGYKNGSDSVDIIQFADGSTFDRAAIEMQIGRINGTAGNDSLSGTSGDDKFYGLDGNDTMISTSGNDLYVGGHGNDVMTAGFGADIYVWAKGDGNDQINDLGSSSRNDTLRLTDVNSSELSLTRNGNDLLIEITTTGEVITVTRQYQGTQGFGIELIEFADGSTWNRDQIADISAPTIETFGTEGADTLAGTAFKDIIHAAGGDDVVAGYDGRDVLLGDAGQDNLNGGNGDDRLIGGAGDDYLIGGGGDDVYEFTLGDGHDTIKDGADPWDSGAGGNDTVVLGAGVETTDVTVTQADNGNDLLLTLASGETLTLDQTLVDTNNQIEAVRFDDGTVWTHADLVTKSLNPTSGADQLAGTNGDDVMSGEGGDDSLNGRWGNDVLIGGTGNDWLSGGGGDDVYRFAAGDGQDVIADTADWQNSGYGGYDTVEFAAGILTGDVTVTEADNGNDLVLSLAGGDSITLDQSTSNGDNRIEQVRFNDGTIWSHSDLMTRATAPTSGADHFWGSYDGETLSGGGGEDWLDGREGADILIGGTGADWLSGGGGNDVYRFASGDGQDVIADTAEWWTSGYGGDDAVEFASGILPGDVTVTEADNGNDLVLTLAGGNSITLDQTVTNSDNRIEQVRFANGTVWSHAELMTRATAPTSGADHFYGSYDGETLSGGGGNDWIDGRHGNDVLIGGAGNDWLSGGGGNDIYRFGVGDGNDTIADTEDWPNSGYGGYDAVEFAAAIAPGDVTVTQGDGGNDLVLTLSSGDSLTLDQAITDGDDRIEEVRFANGTTWTHDDLMALSAPPEDELLFEPFDGVIEKGRFHPQIWARQLAEAGAAFGAGSNRPFAESPQAQNDEPYFERLIVGDRWGWR